jgi:hypothetical protein
MAKKLRLLILLVCSFCSTINARTFELGGDSTLDVSGYVGWTQVWQSPGTHAYNWQPHEKGDILSGPEIGILTNYKFNDRLTIFNQIKMGTSLNDVLVYSFADINLFSSTDWDVSIAGGRLRYDLGLYSQTRVNPRTRPGIVPPQAIYWNSLRELLTSGTGVSGKIRFKDVSVEYSVTDPSIINDKREAENWSGGIIDKFNTHFGSTRILTVNYDPGNGFRAKYNWMTFNTGGKPSNLGNLLYGPSFKEIDELMIAGIEYRKDKWKFSGEAVWFKAFDQNWTGGGHPISGDNSRGFSLTAEYDLNDHVTTRVNYNEYSAGYVPPATPWLHYAKDFNVGIIYHRPNWQVSLEGHHINGGRWVSPDEKF